MVQFNVNVVVDSIIVLHITISIAFERKEWSDKSGIISVYCRLEFIVNKMNIIYIHSK